MSLYPISPTQMNQLGVFFTSLLAMWWVLQEHHPQHASLPLDEAVKAMVAEAELCKMSETDNENVSKAGSIAMVISPLSCYLSPSKHETKTLSSSSISSGGISDAG